MILSPFRVPQCGFKMQSLSASLPTWQPATRLVCNSTSSTSSSGSFSNSGSGDNAVPEGGVRALPNSVLWRLDHFAHLFYDVHGADFVIQRAESSSSATCFTKRPLRRLHQKRTQLSVRRTDAAKAAQAGLIMQAVRSQPMPLIMFNGHPIIDVTAAFVAVDEDIFELDLQEEGNKKLCGPAEVLTSPVSQWGIVPVEPDPVVHAEEEPKIYVTTSTSPRRTHMVGFTCHRCGARCHNAVNPASFHDGTLAACCGKCKTWHKITDKFNLFGWDLRGDEFVRPAPMSMEDVPPALRLPLQPFYWNEDSNYN